MNEAPESRFSSLVRGAAFILDGARITFQIPGLLRFAILPLLICVAIFGLALAAGGYFLGSGANWLVTYLIDPSSGFWFELLYYPVLILSWIILLVVNSYLSFILVSVVAIPFHSLLAERTLMAFKVVEPQPFQFTNWLRFNIKMLWVGLIKGAIFLTLGILLFVLSLIPGLQLFTSLAACFLIAFDSMDYSFESVGLSLTERFAHFRSFFAQFTGMSLGLSVTLVLPGLLVLFYPFAVVGAAHLYSLNLKAKS